jgi:uncharacterized protein
MPGRRPQRRAKRRGAGTGLPIPPRDGPDWACLDVAHASAKGFGLFATMPLEEGELVATVKGTVQIWPYDDAPDTGPRWYGVGRETWIEPYPHTPPAFVNHSCEPSAQVRGRRHIYALRDIAPGEEVTIDYALTEEDPNWSMACACGSSICVGVVRPKASFGPPLRAARKRAAVAPRPRAR